MWITLTKLELLYRAIERKETKIFAFILKEGSKYKGYKNGSLSSRFRGAKIKIHRNVRSKVVGIFKCLMLSARRVY